MDEQQSQNNFTSKIAQYFLHNRVVSAVVLVIIIAGGIASFLVSPKAKDPEMEIPQFQVILDYQGASAEEVEKFVTEKIEGLISDLPNVKKINSVSIDGGKAVITVEFETFVDIESAKISVLSKLNEKEDIIRNAGLSSPVIKNLDSDSMPILEIGFTSDRLNQNQMRALVVDIMSMISKVPGVNNLEVEGGQPRSLRIIPDPGKMQVLNISATDMINAIEVSNIKIPSGKVRQGERFEQVEVNGTFLEKDLAEKIIVKPGVQIRDIAQVEDFFPEKTSASQIWEDDKVQDAVYISVAKVKGQDAQKVSQATQAALEDELKKDKYADLHYALFRDDGEKASESIGDLGREIAIALAAILMILIYFLNFRTAVTVASALPLAVMIAFVVGNINGIVISEVALFGLIIALGLLVDSATVVVEGAYSYIQQGMNKIDAFIRILNESGISIFIANMATIIVFIPLTLISGTVGVYFFPAVFFIIASLFGSLLMAYTMVPYIGTSLLKKEEGNEDEKKSGFVDRVRDKYLVIIERILRSRKKQKTFAIAVVIALVVATLLPVLGFIKQKSVAGGGTYKYSIFIDAPDGTDVIRTQEITNKVIKLAMEKPHVESVQSFIAQPMIPDLSSSARGSDSRNTPNVSTLKVNLDETMASDDFDIYISSVRESLAENGDIKKMMDQNNVKISVLTDPATPVSATIFLRIKGPQEEIRREVANDMVSLVGSANGAIQIDTSMEDAYPKIVYRVDHDKAQDSGVTALDVSNALQSALGPLQISQFHVPGISEPAKIELQFNRQNRNEIADLSKIFIKSASGSSVPLDSVTQRIETRNEPNRLRNNEEPVINVTAEAEKVPSIDVVKQITEKIKNEYAFPLEGKLIDSDKEQFEFVLPNGEIYHIEWGGETESSNETNADLGTAMGIAFLAITMIFIIRFNSIKRALIVISSIPLSFIGVLPAFAILYPLLHVYFTSMSVIGIIALMGIVVNNSILIISYYGIVREKGLAPIEAMLESVHRRFRPILLTTSTAILGNLVMLFDPTWNSLAWTIISGLAASATLVMFMVPILYSLFVEGEAKLPRENYGNIE